jgi:hypothetical protein
MNAITEDETLTQPEEGAQIQEQVEEQPEPLREPEPPIRPLAQARADLEKQLSVFKAFVAELESTDQRLARAEAEEGEILDGGSGSPPLSEQEQLDRLSKILALKKVLERKLERGRENGSSAAAARLQGSVREALRSLWHDLAALRAKREERHLATLKKLVADEEHWPWAIERAKTMMRHFGDLRSLDGLGDQADFSLSHGAVPLAAEQLLSDIGTFEAESGGGRTKR